MTSYTLALLPGDGIGRDVMIEAEKILALVEQLTPLSLTVNKISCGGQHYLETGEEWPEGSFDFCRDEADAILLGAVGWPGAITDDGDLAGGSVILGLRSGLDLYANVRPIRLYEGVRHKIHGEFTQVWKPGMVDMLIVRENTEGLYHSLLRRSADKAQGRETWEPNSMDFPGLEGEVAWDPRPISRSGSERVLRYAFEAAQRRNGAPGDGKTRVTCVDKSNVTRGCQLFNQIYHEIAEEYPRTETDHAYIDAFCMWAVRNPEWFDVVVTPNMFGDISTDLASVLQGGMGIAASANIGDEHGMFEPVHGSAPKYAGQNTTNPMAMISSVSLMFDWLGETKGDPDCKAVGDLIDMAVTETMTGDTLTYDLGGTAGTSEVGDKIAHFLEIFLRKHFAVA
ncbi:MAG: isocitrate/isopropylmalate dehydrogenase family protein [Candidatus Thalassarchaeaceae archaeon]|jgi:3-isopropylmalate dehydrogenase|nr:isocitrate/isopropylmalate dehydrogenase family protein [Candidatus Thalassarchaeaceae archaeon]